MTKQEAIEAMERGEKVTHERFLPEEWVSMKKEKVISTYRDKENPIDFWKRRELEDWNDGWSIWEEKV